MDVSNMKNMVVLKNLPSNIIDEAIIVLKSNKKVKNLEKIVNYKTCDDNSENKNEEEYIIKEAELLVNDYICKIEDNKKEEKNDDNEWNERNNERERSREKIVTNDDIDSW